MQISGQPPPVSKLGQFRRCLGLPVKMLISCQGQPPLASINPIHLLHSVGARVPRGEHAATVLVWAQSSGREDTSRAYGNDGTPASGVW